MGFLRDLDQCVYLVPVVFPLPSLAGVVIAPIFGTIVVIAVHPAPIIEIAKIIVPFVDIILFSVRRGGKIWDGFK